jgi:hypothetical protein
MIPFSTVATPLNPMVATIIPKIVPEMKLNISFLTTGICRKCLTIL